MAGFPMCPDCSAEYEDPLDRRYHAQPVACPVCGPAVALRAAKSGRPIGGGIEAAAALIAAGRILAVKGLGGFHLVCDPFNAAAVARLRKIKERRTKPLALMARDTAAVERWARLSAAERRLLTSERRPIVLLPKRRDIPGIAPNLGEIGFMLPYTPLHHLLLEKLELIVATSSNLRDAPIMKDDDEGLSGLCDAVLTHDRPIEMRADDSVVKVVDGRPLFVRRARGYVPYPQKVPDGLGSKRPILALGGELKDTVSVFKNGYVVTSQFLGDLDEYENRAYLEETVSHLTRLFDAEPALVVSDLHPDFHSTRIARRLGLPHLQVQHHHAHILAVMLEHGLRPDSKVLGISWDGYGYGADGGAWGGEFLLADYRSFEQIRPFRAGPAAGGRSGRPAALAHGPRLSPSGRVPARGSASDRRAEIDRTRSGGRRLGHDRARDALAPLLELRPAFRRGLGDRRPGAGVERIRSRSGHAAGGRRGQGQGGPLPGQDREQRAAVRGLVRRRRPGDRPGRPARRRAPENLGEVSRHPGRSGAAGRQAGEGGNGNPDRSPSGAGSS